MRVYLDTMVWSRITQTNPKEIKHQRLKRILADDDYLISTYLSEAHVGDQSRGKPKTEDAKASKRDRCTYMQQRAWGTYVAQDNESGGYNVYRVKLEEDLFGLENEGKDIDLTLLDLDDPDPLTQAMYSLLKLQPFDLEAQIGDGPGSETALTILRQMLPNGMREKTAFGVLKDLISGEHQNVDESILSARLAFAATLGSYDWTKLKDPKMYLDRLLTEQADGKPLHELFDLTDRAMLDANSKISGLELFRHKYLMLGMFGLAPEKRYESANDDAGHAYYATAADFFVTDDLRARTKAKVLFRVLAVKCRVVTSKELLQHIHQWRHLIYKPLWANWISYGLKEALPVKVGLDPNDGVAQTVRAMPCSILYTLNRCQVNALQDDIICSFFRRPVALVNFDVYEDIRKQLRWLTRNLGADLHGLGDYDDEDEKQITSKEKWRGRAWVLIETVWMTFELNEDVGPSLIIRRYTPEILATAKGKKEEPKSLIRASS